MKSRGVAMGGIAGIRRVAALAVGLLMSALTTSALASEKADALMRRGGEAYARGDYAAAERSWRAAERAYAAAGSVDGRLDAWLNLAVLDQRAGRYKVATDTLEDARDLALENGRAAKLVVIENALGVAYTFSRRPAEAEEVLRSALSRIAEQGGDPAAEAGVRVNLGNAYATWAETLADAEKAPKYASAFEHYDAAATLAERAGDAGLVAKGAANAALSAARAGRTGDADRLAARAVELVGALPDSSEKVHLLVAIGQADEVVLTPRAAAEAGPAQGNSHGTADTAAPPLPPAEVGRVQRRAFNAYQSAHEIATRSGNLQAQSYALGYQARLYEIAGHYDDALTLTRRAAERAQLAQSPDALYLWQWQAGRLLRALKREEDAIAALTHARDTLEAVRNDLALGFGNVGVKGTFRQEVGPLYYELADLLLARAAKAPDPNDAAAERDLAEARDTVERLRVGELQSYFQDPCVERADQQKVDLTTQLALVPRTRPAVLYVIPLRDRIEILVTTRQGMRRFTAAEVGEARLTREVRAFRDELTEPTYFYKARARQLYDWLIRPVEKTLADEDIDTLVFVPDGALRTIPMAALSPGGNDVLISKYAVAVSPGLTLQLGRDDPAAVSRAAARVLASGVSVKLPWMEAEALPNVPQELDAIERIFTNGGDANSGEGNGGTEGANVGDGAKRGTVNRGDGARRGVTSGNGNANGARRVNGSGPVKRLLDEEFKSDAFKQELSDPASDLSIVHIASHGVFHADARQTYVVAYDRELSLEFIEELLRPRLLRGRPVSLLTLSACSTSAGDDGAAHERASLGLGGLAVKAGARTAVASLWSADDAATRELMTRFYEELHRNPEAGKAQALRKAQLSLTEPGDARRLQHPRFWAPFLVIGDWL